MKKLLTLSMVMILAINTFAQDLNREFYLLFEFMKVSDENGAEYLEVEEFWSSIHKQRVADKKILGWDLWSLTPSGTEQGSQYLTVTLFATLEDMMQPVSMDVILSYMKKAHPNMSEKEMNALMDKTTKSRDLAHQVYLKQIDWTEGDFEMKIGAVAALGVMKQLDGSYERAESTIFKPWHQQLVNEGKKGSWGFLKTILPTGSDAYSTHITVNMFKDIAQYATSSEAGVGDIDAITQFAVNDGLKTRDMREVKIAVLEMMVR